MRAGNTSSPRRRPSSGSARWSGAPGKPIPAGFTRNPGERGFGGPDGRGKILDEKANEKEDDDEPVASAQTMAGAGEAWDPWRETLAPRLDHSLLPQVVREAVVTSARVSAPMSTPCHRLSGRPRSLRRHAAAGHAEATCARLVAAPALGPADSPPSSMKSEVIKAARALAAGLDIQERERHRRDVATVELGATLAGGAPSSKAALKRARDEAARTVPPARQRVCGDVTIEKLADILGTNPGGCAIIREELSGWLGGLGRYTAKGTDAADRASIARCGTARRTTGSGYPRRMSISSIAPAASSAPSGPDRLLEMTLPRRTDCCSGSCR